MAYLVKTSAPNGFDFIRDENGNIRQFLGFAAALKFARGCVHAVSVVDPETKWEKSIVSLRNFSPVQGVGLIHNQFVEVGAQ